MKKKLLFPFVICSLFISGCYNTDEYFSRYPYIDIPQYKVGDYLNLLSDKNPEIVYSSIVVLGPHARWMGERLSSKKSDKTSAEYNAECITALNAYKKVLILLNSKDKRVLAATLRFLQFFCKEYKMKAELLEPVLQIKSNDPQILYEQILALNIIADKDSDIPDAVLRKFLNNHSWIVSRSAYLLVNSLKNERIRKELFHKYKSFNEEKEKLLILTAFKAQCSDSLTDSFLEEVLKTKNAKIRNEIYDILVNCQNQEKVLLWLDQNYDKLASADKEYLFLLSGEPKFLSKLKILWLKHGFMPQASFLEDLNKDLDGFEGKTDVSESDKERLNDLLEIEKTLQTNKLLSEQWTALRKKTKALNAELINVQNGYNIITQEYVKKIVEYLDEHNVSDEKKQEYIKGVDELLRSHDIVEYFFGK